MKKKHIAGLALALAAGLTAAGLAGHGSSYDVKVALSSATNLVKGGRVEVNGFTAGTIGDIALNDGKVVLDLKLDKGFAPIHSGAKVVVTWKALLGERIVNINDGAATNPLIPSGGTITGSQVEPVELDQVFGALDAPTRKHLSSLLARLATTTAGASNQARLNQTIRTTGPALQELGSLLRAAGADGTAVKSLVKRSNAMVRVLATRSGVVSAMVRELDNLSRSTGAEHHQLEQALTELPGALNQTATTLSHVPAAVDATTPLLVKLRSATGALPAAARALRPVLTDLRPASRQLRGSLAYAAQLLRVSPALLDTTRTTLPQLETTLNYLAPALAYLRPYTPEAVGWLSNWASAFSSYDRNGHYARIFGVGGPSTFTGYQTSTPPPGLTNNTAPLPGQIVGQPWTDAFGSGVN